MPNALPTGHTDTASPLPARRRFLGLPLPWSRAERNAWRRPLVAAGLPAPINDLIERVIRSSRLWPNEKSDVARELAAHFTDALASGLSVDDARTRFGDPRSAAKLIRRSTLRKRPWWWQTRLRINQALGVITLMLLCVYGWYAVLTITGRPSITRLYAAEHNSRVAQIPEPDRAWPEYLKTFAALGPLPPDLAAPPIAGVPARLRPDGSEQAWPYRPGDDRWPETAAWIDAQRSAIALAHAATRKPVYGAPYYATDPAAPSTPVTPEAVDFSRLALADASTSGINILLPDLRELRRLSRALVVEARRAAELGDQDRALAALESLVGLTRHAGQGDVLIQDLVANALAVQAAATAREIVGLRVFDADHLRRLWDVIAGLDEATIQITFSGERVFIDDLLQRIFTDDAQGDGRLTYTGFRQLTDLTVMNESPAQPVSVPARTVQAMVAPIAIAASDSRSQTRALFEKHYAAAAAEANTPYWKRSDSSIDIEVDRLVQGARALKNTHLVAGLLLPALGKAATVPELSRQHRDATLVAIALERHRAARGVYPPTLADLVPAFLPTLPPDRFDAAPLKYRLIGAGSDARPLLYSVGVDRTDDGGHANPSPANDLLTYTFRGPSYIQSLLANPATRPSYVGDWILYDPAGIHPRLPETRIPSSLTPPAQPTAN